MNQMLGIMQNIKASKHYSEVYNLTYGFESTLYIYMQTFLNVLVINFDNKNNVWLIVYDLSSC